MGEDPHLNFSKGKTPKLPTQIKPKMIIMLRWVKMLFMCKLQLLNGLNSLDSEILEFWIILDFWNSGILEFWNSGFWTFIYTNIALLDPFIKDRCNIFPSYFKSATVCFFLTKATQN